jgi:uncharacterized membrane protein
MRWTVGTLLLLALAGSTQSQLTGNYNIVLEENGNSLVTLVVTGIGTINVPLPLDVRSPAVRDALYIKAKNGVEVSIDAGGQSTIVYKTALLTSREGGDWRFRMQLPALDSATVILNVPVEAVVSQTEPNAAISHVGRSKSVIWNVKPGETPLVEAQYTFTGTSETTQPSTPPETGYEGQSSIAYAVLVIIIPVLATLAILYLIRSRRGAGRLVLSPGKQNVLKTLTGNETKVVNLLLQNRGGMRRNELERASGIPKSSLASSLYNLEQRNVIRVDKSSAVHFVELTEWYKSL